MLIDTSMFPVVWMRLAEPADKAKDESLFSEFEALLARKESLVFINDEGLDLNQHDHSKEEMQIVAQWRKQHKRELHSLVKGTIYIEPSEERRLAAKDFAVMFEKFWGYTMLTAPSRDEALALAKQLLSQ